MKKTVIFIIIFAALGLLLMQFSLTQLVGSQVKFTLFDFFGPVAAGFIGTIPGLIAVAAMQIGNFLLHGAVVVDAGTIIRLFPMLFAAWYFSRQNKPVLIVPILAIIAWNLHPIGREVWYYSMFWLIPIVMHPFYKFLPARALGATFTAHAVGGAAWIWVFNLPAPVWNSLIPIVAIERALFALGICATYLVLNNLMYLLENKLAFLQPLVDHHYVFHKISPNQNPGAPAA